MSKKKNTKLPLFEASSTLIGTVIGAGILGVPYAMAQVGFPLGIAIMFVLAVAIMVRHLMLAEVTLSTPKVHQMPGYVGIYMGKWAKRISMVVVVLGSFGSLLAYTIGEGEVLSAMFGGGTVGWSVIFFIFAILFVFVGLSLIKKSELVMTALILFITVGVGFFAWNNIEFANFNFWSVDNWILPYGVFLFALTGSVAIPEMREELQKRESTLPKAVILASVVTFLVYVLFSFLVLGVTGTGTTEVATIGLGERIGPEMLLIGNLLAFFTMGTSFLTIGLGMKEMLQYDYHWKPIYAWWLTALVPITLFLAGARDFILVLGIVGGVLAGIQSVLIVLTYWRARKMGWRKSELSLGPMRVSGVLLIAIFTLGAIFTIVSL